MNESFHNECTSLDDYLHRELTDEAALRFETHLGNCAACRDAVEQQRWIDEGLLLDAAMSPPAPAAMLTTAAEAIVAVRRQQRVRRLLAGSFAAAATVAAIAAWSWRMPVSAPGSAGGSASTPNSIAQRDTTPRQSQGPQEEPPPPAKSVATFTAGSGGIAIPVASESPEVTIVQFYSTTEADRRLQRQRELEAKYRELVGG